MVTLQHTSPCTRTPVSYNVEKNNEKYLESFINFRCHVSASSDLQGSWRYPWGRYPDQIS